ncbi:demethylmenaquinone methyltransferase [Enemella sp. A6]|uniref:demethylmenaquinone methyltransferase n=1 Tax=Enemella sp. A6 TaxID=3440152 RepID=UPI003EB81816
MSRADYRATLAKRRNDVATMFDGVAQRYDLVNELLSFGQANRWRPKVVEAIDPKPGEVILDLAAGTGTSSRPIADLGATVVATDLSLGMLAVGKQRQPDLTFIAGDALRLPFADDAFDAVTISFGIRNFEDTEAALVELRRITRPGGRLVICEFSTPTWAPFRTVYQNYLMAALPTVARAAASNPTAYVYLAESIRAWPNQEQLAAMLSDAGWRSVQWRNLSAGIVAVHRGWA